MLNLVFLRIIINYLLANREQITDQAQLSRTKQATKQLKKQRKKNDQLMMRAYKMNKLIKDVNKYAPVVSSTATYEKTDHDNKNNKKSTGSKIFNFANLSQGGSPALIEHPEEPTTSTLPEVKYSISELEKKLKREHKDNSTLHIALCN